MDARLQLETDVEAHGVGVDAGDHEEGFVAGEQSATERVLVPRRAEHLIEQMRHQRHVGGIDSIDNDIHELARD